MSISAPTDETATTSPIGSSLGLWFAGLAEGLSAIRAPLAMSIITILALWLPQQVWELYRVLMQQRPETEPWILRYQWIAAILALVLLSIVLWQIARELTHSASERRNLDRTPVAKFILDWSPRIFSTAPFIGAALGLWQSLPPKRLRVLSQEVEEYAPLSAILDRIEIIQRNIWMSIGFALVSAVLVFVAITLFERRLLNVTPGRQLTETKGRRFFFISHWFVFPIVGTILIAVFAWDPVRYPSYVGVIPIFALWVTISTVLLAVGTRIYDRYRIPVITIAIVALLIFEFLGLSDNHKFRQLDQRVMRTDVATAFVDWLSSRADVESYRGTDRPYPVYIVAAEGGGMYAAYHTAKFLSRMQDLCESFAQHVFAVSAVSGGSLGSSVFAALTQNQAQKGSPKPCTDTYTGKPGTFELKAEEVLSHDFLSPLIYAGLFPDFVQRFLPVPIPRFDRALALEHSFEFAWQQTHLGDRSDNPFAASYFDLCGAGSGKCPKEAVGAPALIINTTNVETGMQMVLSPMDLTGLRSSPTGSIEDMYLTSSELNQVRLSTAVGLSARSPWVLPVGWYEFKQRRPDKGWVKGIGDQNRRMSFVDGGYFEGSGVATADNLAQYLDQLLQDRQADLQGLKVSIKIIMITGTYFPVDRFFNTVQASYTPGELISPVSTLLQAWRARSSAFPAEFAGEKRKGPIPALPARFDNDLITIPLGWQLTKLSRDYLELFAGRPENCKAFGPDDVRPDEPLQSMNDSDCTIKAIIQDLRQALRS
jgi:hypothetical protein